MQNKNPDVLRHLYSDLDATRARLREFSRAKRSVRLLVLATLRQRAGDQSSSLELGLAALILAALALIISPAPELTFEGQPFLTAVALGAVLGLGGLIALAPIWIPHMIRQRKQEYAQVWLAAYLDEIQRRQSW